MSLSTPDAVTAAGSALSKITKTKKKRNAVYPGVLTAAPLGLFTDEAEAFGANYRPAKTEDQ